MPSALPASFCSFPPARPVISGGDASSPPRMGTRPDHLPGRQRATDWPSLPSGAASDWEFVRNAPRERG